MVCDADIVSKSVLIRSSAGRRAAAATLPAAGQDAVTRLMSAGPPSEAVGLQPFQLTVPPRRVGEGV